MVIVYLKEIIGIEVELMGRFNRGEGWFKA